MIYIKLLRIHTLFLSASSILLGVLLAISLFPIVFIPFFKIVLLFLTAFTLQIISNIANDYGDGLRGVDKANSIGFDRLFAQQKISKRAILSFLVFFILLCLIFGFLLVWLSFDRFSFSSFLLIGLGIVSVFAALKYSIGKNPHSMSGLGDISVLFFFGWVAVLGSFFLIQKKIPMSLFLESSAIGFLHVSVLNLNNIRDLESDKQSNRKTIAIRLGEKNAKIYQQLLVCSSLFLFFIAGVVRIEKGVQWLVFLFFIPLLWRSFSLHHSKEYYNGYLKKQCLLIFLFTLSYSSSFLLNN